MLCLLLAFTLSWNGCRLARETVAMPQRTVQAVTGTTPKQLDPAETQAMLMRYADDAINRINRRLEDYMERPEATPEDVEMGMRARLAHARTLVGLVTSPNPNVALVDALSMATLTRMSLEAALATPPDGEKFGPMLATARTIETNAWAMADRLLKPEQQEELRRTLETYYRESVASPRVLFSRPQDFAIGVQKSLRNTQSQEGGFLSFLTLDPMAGLDPAVREVTQTRLFAERALFAAQQAPRLLRWEIELLTMQLTRQPEAQTLLSNSTTLSASLDRASRTAAELPDRITREREAIMKELEDQEGQLIALSADLKQTLEAGQQMSTSLNTTLTTFDALMKRFGVGEPKPHTPPDPSAEPFDILDYAKTAGEVAAMAEQLQGVLRELNTTLDSPALDAQISKLDAVSAQTTARVRGLLNHAFLLAAGLILLAFGCALGLRKLGRGPKP